MTSENKKGGLNLLPFKIYGVGYAIITILALISSFGGTYDIAPMDFAKSYKVGPESFLRVAGNYTFTSGSGAAIVLEGGQRVNEFVAREMLAQINAEKFPYKNLELYKEGWFWNLHWGGIFTFYNLLGLFVGLYFGLKAPLMAMIDDSRRKIEGSLQTARNAQTEASNLQKKYDELLASLEKEKVRLSGVLKEEQELEKEKIMKQAKHEAEGIIESIKHSVDGEILSAAERLRKEVAQSALRQAREILAKEITAEDHENAFNDFISDLERTSK